MNPDTDEREGNSRRSTSTLESVGRWLISPSGNADDRRARSLDGSPPNPEYRQTHHTPNDARTFNQLSASPFSPCQGHLVPDVRSVHSLPVHLRESPGMHFHPIATPQPVVTPPRSMSTIDGSMGTKKLQQDLNQAEMSFRQRQEPAIEFDDEGFADSIAEDTDLCSTANRSIESSITNEQDMSSSKSSSKSSKKHRRRQKSKPKKHVPAIVLKGTLIIPSVEGFDHPVLRSASFTKRDESTTQGQFNCCVVKEGWDRTIVSSHAAAWVRTADHKESTKCASFPDGIPPIVQGFESYDNAVRYLGWDPKISAPLDRPHGIDPKPPKRRSVFDRPELNLGEDPHVWCGQDIMSYVFTIEEENETGSSGTSSDGSGATDTIESLTDDLNKKMRDATQDHFDLEFNPSAKAAKKEEECRRLLDKTRWEDLPSLDLEPDFEALHTWWILATDILAAPHWCVGNTPMHSMSDDGPTSDAFQHRSRTLARLLVGRLTTDKHIDVLDEFPECRENGHGVTLLHNVRTFLDPLTDRGNVETHKDFFATVQHNGETAKSVSRRVKRHHDRLAKAGCALGDDLKKLQSTHSIINGACADTKSFQTLTQDLIHGRFDVKSMTCANLVDKVHNIMISAGLVKNNEAQKVVQPRARRIGGGMSATDGADAEDQWFGQTCLDESSARMQFQLTSCLFCRFPKGHPEHHFMSDCKRLKRCGCGVTHDSTKDERRKQFQKQSTRSNTDSDTDNESESQKKRDNRKARLAKAKDNDTTNASDDETNSPPDNPPESSSTDGGRGNRVSEGTATDTIVADDDRFFSCSFVDVHNDKDESTDYFKPLECLSQFDRIDPTGRRVRCAGRADHRMRCRIAGRKAKVRFHSDMACLDSGATSDMLNHKRHFDKYQHVDDMVVFMGDGTPAKVAGAGTARIKIDGKIIVLDEVLHVPSLDCNLLSVTKHALRGNGCGCTAMDGMCHMHFPKFALSRRIPNDGDPMFALERLKHDDANHSDCSHRGHTNNFENFKSRLAFLRRVHKARALTRGGQRKLLNHLKSMLKSGKINEELLKDLGTSLTKPDNSTHARPVEAPKVQPSEHITPAVPNCAVPESAKGATPERHSRYELETPFGGRSLKDCSILSRLGTGLRTHNNNTELNSIGKLVNIKRGRRRRRSGEKSLSPLDLVGMDIGHGAPDGPGGHKCVLVLVDKCTTHCWICGMSGTSGNDIQEALWKFFVEAGGFPETLQCDFDPRFVGGKAAKLLRAHGCAVRAAPPGRQSQNGLVERRWQMLESMARTCLTAANLPKRFWHWAVREASRRLNILPVSANSSNKHDPAHMTTPFEAFCGTKPDYRILFPFGSIGAFRRPRDGNKTRHTFDSQGMLGIALGRSEFTNGMIFHNPVLDSFCTSADYRLDPHQGISQHFPSVVYDGGLSAAVMSNQQNASSKFDPNDTVFVRADGTDNIERGRVHTAPTSLTKLHTVIPDNGTSIDAPVEDLIPEDANPETPPSATLGFFTPEWLKQDCKVTLLADGQCRRGYLNLDADDDWEFVTRNKSGQCLDHIPLLDLHCSWKHRIQENSLILGWQEDAARRVCGIGRHVSAATLRNQSAPTNPIRGLSPENPDAPIWNAAHDEECDGLDGLDTFAETSEAEYDKLVQKHGDKCKAIPTMNIFTAKKDKDGNPVRAKSRIVALGNLERRIWEKGDRYAPVLKSTSGRLLISMAIQDGRIVKQGDCKNAFCQPTIPEEEITVVIPPKGCPRSKPGTCWRLQKTSCGLARSARHWFDTFSTMLKRDLGFESMPHDPCVLKATPIEGEAPVCSGCYVDDFIYCSKSDKVEAWFENALSAKLRVDFMGAVSWFLGCSYDWRRTKDGSLSAHVSQQACVEGLVDKFNLNTAKTVRSPHRSGCPIDRMPKDDKPAESKAEPVRNCQSLMGGLNWLATCTRPDMNVACNLLGRFNANPSQGHMDAALHVLKCLRTTASHGIQCIQGQNPLSGHVSFPPHVDADDITVFTDANFGPQDASVPKENDTRTCDLEEMHSIAGCCVSMMGGPLEWKVVREKRISGSSCEAEIKAMDEGVKGIQFVRHLTCELGIADKDRTIPIPNDNSGAIDWTKTGGATSKKTRHMNIREFRVAESQQLGEIECKWIPGKENPSDLFAKEHRDTMHFEALRDLMLCPVEKHLDC